MARRGVTECGKAGQGKARQGKQRAPKRPLSCDAATVEHPRTGQMFANPSLLSLKDVNSGIWPHGDKDRPLVFHPVDILNALPFNAPFTTKHALITAFVELTRAVDTLWNKYRQEIDEPIKSLRPYLNRIYTEYGEAEMRNAIDTACLLSPNSARLIDYSADNIGSWLA